jgi:ABC-2 type transport system permease protein
MTWWNISLCELKILVTQKPKLIFSMFVVPFCYLLLFGTLFSKNSVDQIPLVICDESQTYFSSKLTDGFENTERFSVVQYVDSPEEVQQYLYEKKAIVGIGIPKDFAHDIKNGLASQIVVEINGTNLMVTNTAITATQDVFDVFAQQTALNSLRSQSGIKNIETKIVPVQMKTRILHNPTLDYKVFFLFGLLMTSFQMTMFIPTTASFFMEYKAKQYTMYAASHVVIGKVLPFIMAASLAFIMHLTIAVFVFDLPYKGDLRQVFLLGLGFIFAMTTLASVIASFIKDFFFFYRLALAATIPVFMISGYTWPSSAMPWIIQKIAFFIPYTHIASSLRSFMTAGFSPVGYEDIFILYMYGGVMLLWSIYRYKRFCHIEFNIVNNSLIEKK